MKGDKEIHALFQRILGSRFNALEPQNTAWMMMKYGLLMLRLTLGIVYLWFGILKFSPDATPASALIRRSYDFLPGDILIPAIGGLEALIGLGFISGVFLRLTIFLMGFQILGSLSPMVLEPSAVWKEFPFILTLEGQYIVKDFVLFAAALVIGAAVYWEKISSKSLVSEELPAQSAS